MLKMRTTTCHPFCEPRMSNVSRKRMLGSSNLLHPSISRLLFPPERSGITARLRESMNLREQSLFGQVE